MKRFTYTIFLIFIAFPVTAPAGIFSSSNFYECILDDMPGTENDQVAAQIFLKCKKEHPNKSNIKKKSSIFGIKTRSECILKYGKSTASKLGVANISNACYKLYPKQK